jgi:hypothetical protein
MRGCSSRLREQGAITAGFVSFAGGPKEKAALIRGRPCRSFRGIPGAIRKSSDSPGRGKNVRTVRVTDVRASFARNCGAKGGLAKSADAQRQAFTRALKAALADGLVKDSWNGAPNDVIFPPRTVRSARSQDDEVHEKVWLGDPDKYGRPSPRISSRNTAPGRSRNAFCCPANRANCYKNKRILLFVFPGRLPMLKQTTVPNPTTNSHFAAAMSVGEPRQEVEVVIVDEEKKFFAICPIINLFY